MTWLVGDLPRLTKIFLLVVIPFGGKMGNNTSSPAAPVNNNASSPPAGCPMHNKDALNPANNIPELKQAPSPGQKTQLPLQRTISSIPRSDRQSEGASACPVNHEALKSGDAPRPATAQSSNPAASNWEYPSPQQFYNALVRKGWETPEESVEMMVNIHNWLNEAAWQQVRTWEEKHPGSVLATLDIDAIANPWLKR